MKQKNVGSAILFIAVISLFLLIALGAWNAETIYGSGVIVLFGGIIILAIGNSQVQGNIRRNIRDTIRMAKTRSRFWWLPFAGISVALAGSILLHVSDGATNLEKLLSILLVTLTYFYTMQIMPKSFAIKEPAG